MTVPFALPNTFRHATPGERIDILQDAIAQSPIGQNDVTAYPPLLPTPNKETLDMADMMIEHACGVMAIPMGIVINMPVDTTLVHIPIATEEPSVIAAASYTAKILQKNNISIATHCDPPLQTAQISLQQVSHDGEQALQKALPQIKTDLMVHLSSMQARGGGLRRVEYRRLSNELLVVHIIIDVRNAMGANIVNTAAEFAAPKIAAICGGVVLAAILSNYTEERIVHASFEIETKHIPSRQFTGDVVAARIEAMYQWALEDIYRATTHNKGVMNGITALAVSTGNDSRAIEAAAHAFAASTRNTRQHNAIHSYTPLTTYRYTHGRLQGSIKIPAVFATVGGSTNHPTAIWTRRVMSINYDEMINAHTLNRIAAALGLAQNFAALLALTTQGIQTGHMKLHKQKHVPHE